jgi:Tfp pilus assembly protein PilN
VTATINLLPPEVGQHRRARRLAALTAGAVALYLALLGGLYAVKSAAVASAERQRAAEQAEVTRLDAERAQLQPYGELVARHDNRSQLLAAAMATHVSWSKVLNDLSQSFPANSSLSTLTTAPAAQDAAAGASATGGEIDLGATVADIQFTGYTVERFAPGTSRLLLDVDTVPSFSDPSVSAAGVEERNGTPVTTFTGSVELDEDAYSHRYDQGLPPEVAS